MRDNKKLISRLEKIYNLATRGIGGEKETAGRKLAELMAAHNMTIEELREVIEQEQYYEFPYFDKMEKSLLIQVYCKVLNCNSMEFRANRDRKRRIRIKLTPSQYKEISQRYTLLKKALRVQLKEVMEMTQQAFFSKNNLFGDPDPDAETQDPGFDMDVFSQIYNSMWAVADPNARKISNG